MSDRLDADQDGCSVDPTVIWVQTVCKGYQQMTKVTAIKERYQISDLNLFIWGGI